MTKILLSCTLLICSVVVMRVSIAKFFVAVLSFFTLRKMLALKRLKFSLVWIILFGLGINQSKAQIDLEESFRNKATSSRVTVGGTGVTNYLGGWKTELTAMQEDTNGNGWLRLTKDKTDQSGYVFVNQAFSSTLGIIAEFEYKTWGNLSNGKTGFQDRPGDGLSVFLYDGNIEKDQFKIGPYGASLGYASKNTGAPPYALSGGYFAVGFDEFGNFSSAGLLNGGPANIGAPQSIVVRGPSPLTYYIGGTSSTINLKGLQGRMVSYGISTTTRPSDNDFYRKARIILLPTDNHDFTVKVQLQIQPNGKFYTVIKDVQIGTKAPENLKIGFAAATGGAVANHEIRDVKITTPVDFTITKTANKIAANATADEITYTLLVTNVSKNSARATISDILPAELTLVNGSISFTKKRGLPSNFSTNVSTNNNALTNMSVDLSPGASGIITYRAQTNVSDPNLSSLLNTATITPPDGFSDQNLNDNTSTAEVLIKHTTPITLKFTAPDIIRGNRATLVASIPAQAEKDVIVSLQADQASSTARLPYDYTIIGGGTQYMVIVIPQGQTSVTKEIFLTTPSTVVDEIKTLTLSPTIIDPLYTITDKPSINIIDNIPIELSFTPNTLHGGTASTLTAKIKDYRTSKSPITITLNPNTTSTAVNRTNYDQPPASITIPANANSVSITIPTYNTGDNSDKILYVSGIPPIDGNQYPPIADAELLIKYPPISHHITLEFNPSTVEGGRASILTASLSGTMKAPAGGITITLIKSGSAIANANYTDNFNTIFIPANHHSTSITVSTIHTNTIHGDLELNVNGTPTNGYQIASDATLHIVDHPDNKTITLTFSPTTIFGGDTATLIASLPAGIKAPEGGITITVNDNSSSNVHPAKSGRDFETTELPQLIYIQKNHNSGSVTITTKKDWIYKLFPEASMKRNLTVQGIPTGEYTIASNPTLIIDQHKKPIPIKLTLLSPLPTDNPSEITSGSTALLHAKVELPPGKQIPSEGVVINLDVNPLLSTAIAGTHYNLAAPDHISGGTTTQTITFKRSDILTEKQRSIFSTHKQNIIGGRTRLTFTATCSNEKYYIVNEPFIDIVDKPANFPRVYFDPQAVMCGTSSTLTAAFFENNILKTPSGITSVSPTIIMLTPDASSSALSGTHYSGLPASITIPAGQSFFSIPIHTVDTREVNIQRRLIVEGRSQRDDGSIISITATLDILYPTVPKPQIDPSTVLNKTICSGEPVDIALKTTPPNTECQWTAKLEEGTVDGLMDNNEGYAIVDVLKNTGATPGKVIYTVTPITTMPNGTKVEGDPKQIVVTILPISAKMADRNLTFKDTTEIISFPVDAKPNIIYTWYDKDKNQIHNSAGINAKCDIPISEPGTYTYYMTQTEPEHCPGDFGKITITLTRSITLSFDTPTVGGGSQAKLTAKLAPDITAPIGGVEILLTPTTDQSTTAKNGANYIGLIDKITIPAGENSFTVDAFTATNNHILNGSTQLTLEGTGPINYGINKPNPTITILDKTGDDPKAKIITLAFDKHLVKGGNEAILTISLPKGVTSALPIKLKLGKVKNKSTAKRNINYRTYPDFITIPANQNQVKYHLKTLSEGNLGDTKSLWINGEASGYKVNTDGINIKNPDRIHIPNVFTPNDDGENDFWIIQGIDFYPKCTVTVYNRWGKKVLFSVGYTQPWDGKQSDQPLPPATYYYVIDLKNGSKPISGHVAIVR